MLSPFSPFNQSVGGGGVLSPFGSFNQWGGGGGAVPFQLIQSVEGGGGAVPFRPIQSVGGGGGGAYMLTFIIRAPFSPKGGGGGPWPPCPHSGDAHDWLCRPCLLGGCSAGALQALPMVLM